jgi:hypothetical protein
MEKINSVEKSNGNTNYHFEDKNLEKIFQKIVDNLDNKVNSYFKDMDHQKDLYFDHVKEDLLNLEEHLKDHDLHEKKLSKDVKTMENDELILIKAESNLILQQLKMIEDAVDQVDKIPKFIENEKISKILGMKEDKFEKLVFHKGEKEKSEFYPAHIIMKGLCKSCRYELTWSARGNNNYNNQCPYNDNCSTKYKYSCETCEVRYCLNCVHPINPDICGCGLNMDRRALHSNSCDPCRDSLRGGVMARRCDNCDFDVCDSCYDKWKSE